MANPYFNATYYLTSNKDVAAAVGLNADAAYAHYINHGAQEALSGAVPSRSPAPWFDIVYYVDNNPDLVTANLTAAQLFQHFVDHGMNEGRAPSSAAAALNDASLLAYAKANSDLAQAYKIPADATTLDATQKLSLTKHFYEHGYKEDRPSAPFEVDLAPGQTFTLTVGQDTFVGNAGNNVFNAPVLQNNAGNAVDTLEAIDSLEGGDGNDTLNATVTSTTAAAPTLKSIENVNLRFAADNATVSLANATGVENLTVQNSTTKAAGVGVVAGVGTIANLAVKNQATGATFTDNTATTLNLGLDNVGVAGTAAVITFADAVTTLNVAANNAVASTLTASTGNVTSLNVAATGSNTLTLATAATAATVTGTGSLNLATAFTTLAKLDASKNIGGVTATVDAKAVDVKGGSGNDSITFNAGGGVGIAATAVVALGAGDDTLTVAGGDTIAAGATLSGGEGTDTLAMDVAAYTTAGTGVANFSAANLAKITGFEVLSITDALTAAIDVSKIAGITSFQTVGATGAQTVSGLGATTAVIMKGDLDANTGALNLGMKDASGTADSVSLTLNHTANLTTASTLVTVTVGDLAGVETLNVNAMATDTDASSAGSVAYTLTVSAASAADLNTLNISGDQTLSFASTADMLKLTTIDASANTAGVVINADLAAAAAPALTIRGTNKADTITGSDKGDTITLGGGNDILAYNLGGASKIGSAGTFDVITDFSANTFGNATGNGAGAQANWTGDVLQVAGNGGVTTALVDVLGNAANATTFLQNNSGAAGVVAALDSSTGNLYVDNTGDGTADYFIQLQGVSTIDAAAFSVV